MWYIVGVNAILIHQQSMKPEKAEREWCAASWLEKPEIPTASQWKGILVIQKGCCDIKPSATTGAVYSCTNYEQ